MINQRNQIRPEVQTRFVQISDVEIRFDETQKGAFTFSGYAVKWQSINTHRERFEKGAFSDFINAFKAKSQKCHMYYNHGWQFVYVDPTFAMRIGKWLDFEEDEIGLRVTGELTPKLSLASDVEAMIQHETIDGLSIGFFQPNEMDIEDNNDHIVIKRAALYEISVCDEPSDKSARLDTDVRHLESHDDIKNYLEKFNIPAEEIMQRIKATQPDLNELIKMDSLDWLKG